MAIAHLICGLPGAGKTIFARRLEQDIPHAVRYTHDEWMHRRHGEDPDEEQFAQYYLEIEEDIWRQAREDLLAGKDVIFDFGFWSRRSRDEARKAICDLGSTSKLYWMDAPEDLRLRRVMERSKSVPADSLYIDQNAFFGFLERFEPPETDELPILITSQS